MRPQTTSTNLYSKIKHEAKIFSNIIYILGKIEQDGFFQSIADNYEKIVRSEMIYAVNELKKIQRKTPSFDLKGQLINNTYIYKENLKVLSNMIIDQIWKEKVKEDSISEIVTTAALQNFYNRGEEIPEVRSEDEGSEHESVRNTTGQLSPESSNRKRDDVPASDNSFNNPYPSELKNLSNTTIAMDTSNMDYPGLNDSLTRPDNRNIALLTERVEAVIEDSNVSHDEAKSFDRVSKTSSSKKIGNLQKTLENFMRRGGKKTGVKLSTKGKHNLASQNIQAEKNTSPPPNKATSITIEKISYNDKETPRPLQKDANGASKRRTPPNTRKKSSVSAISSSKHVAQLLGRVERDLSHSRIKKIDDAAEIHESS